MQLRNIIKEMNPFFCRMKPSDSTNSLTELTAVDECFICLSAENGKKEPLVSSQMLRTCGCKFFVHPNCWNQWIKEKSDYDCPICRKQSMLRINIPPNPIFYAEGFQESRHQRNNKRLCKWILLSFVLIFCIALLVSLIYRN